MKKIIFSLFLICLMALSVTAAPQLPYIMYGKVNWNDQLLTGARLEVTYNGVATELVTNEQGNWVYQLSEYTDGTTVNVRVTDGCGTSDVCQKSVVINSVGNKDFAILDFSITGDLVCPPANCPSCSDGGSGDVDLATEEKCAEKFPCEATVCDTCATCEICEVPKECTATECQDVCDETVCDEECPDCDNGWLYNIMFSIGGLVLGTFGWWSGFKGLVNYRVKKARTAELAGDKKEADKQYKAAAKMVQTAVEKAKAGEYDK